LALGAALGAWLEWALLYRALRARLGAIGTDAGSLIRMVTAALAAAAVGFALKLALGELAPLPRALLVALLYGTAYFAAARVLGLTDARALLDSVRRRLVRGSSGQR
jgi:hypothetical protein